MAISNAQFSEELSCRVAAPNPMKMGSRWVTVARSSLGCEAVIWFGALSPQRNLVPDLGSTLCRTPPCRPPVPGEHEEETAQSFEVAPSAGQILKKRVTDMNLIHTCCAGLDVHKKTVVACIRRVGADGAVSSQVRTFGTMTAELWRWRTGWTPRALVMWLWNRPGFTGSRFTTC